VAYHVETCAPVEEGHVASAVLAAVFDAPSFVTVPLRYRTSTTGRVYLLGRRAFSHADADFLLQVVEQAMPVIDNIRLVDRLASEAAETERQRIARDLHDSVIQPYIGLQIGLAALRQQAVGRDRELADAIERLYHLTGDGIADLRGYVRGLRAGSSREHGLPTAIRRFTTKFSEVTGITVAVEAAADLRCSDRLAAEVFQIVSEALSNIRRHTAARRATIRLGCDERRLHLHVSDYGAGVPAPPFVPRSITERAQALGGTAHVERASGQTTVSVHIPL
jgi:signal transduction histidine kinase